MSEPSIYENLLSIGQMIRYWLNQFYTAWTTAVVHTPTIATPQAAVALTVSGGGTPSDTSAAINVTTAGPLSLQIRNGNSTSLNVYVYGSPDNTIYDDVAWASCNLGANQEKSIAISPGIYYAKVTVTNADAANTTIVTTKLTRIT